MAKPDSNVSSRLITLLRPKRVFSELHNFASVLLINLALLSKHFRTIFPPLIAILTLKIVENVKTRRMFQKKSCF